MKAKDRPGWKNNPTNLILLIVIIGIWIFGRYLPTHSFLNHLTIDQQVLLAVLASMIVPAFS